MSLLKEVKSHTINTNQLLDDIVNENNIPASFLDYTYSNQSFFSRIGQIISIGPDNQILIDFPGNKFDAIPARTLISVSKDDIHKNVLILFDHNIPEKPIIIGIIKEETDHIKEKNNHTENNFHSLDNVDSHIKIDGKKLILQAENEIEFRCGDCMILLKKDGDIIIKGINIISRAYEQHKIKGGSVTVN